MSDKGYGDCTNRNVVKNPLLSTTVTGLSVEDLTHNAVLLPAVPSQELITRQDQQTEFQNVTLRHSDHDITNFPSGDAASNSTPFKPPSSININPIQHQKQLQNVKSNENFISMKSKDTIRSDDDFDVNEYFARLQGTRYVSAPINSHIKEDQNANLQAEENLEEINLNEPEKAQTVDDFQHSLTADIAQNFSQLPTVLPQVASAVFSSFSNMLSLKSKEQIPDDTKMYRHAQMQDMSVPLGVQEPQPVAPAAPPPLKEPPMSSNTSNYRITTKKKVYAQIPGLSSGDNQVHTFNTPPIGQTLNYFTPDMNISDKKQDNVGFDQISQDVNRKEEIMPKPEDMKAYDMFNKNALQTDSFPPKAISSQHQEEIINVFHQNTPVTKYQETANMHENIFINQSHVKPPPASYSDTFGQTKEMNIQEKLQDNLNYSSNQFIPISQEPSAIIPPPPMFSSLPRRDSQSSGKSILPPSVARRIGANQPVIKNQTSNIPLPDNIFIPAVTPDIDPLATRESQTYLTQNIQQDPIHNSQDVQTAIKTSQEIPNAPFFTQPPNSMDMSSMKISHNYLGTSKLESEKPTVANIFNPYSENITQLSNILDKNIIPLEKGSQSNLNPPMFFNPANVSQTTINSPHQGDQSQFHSNDIVTEPPKPILEPPKLSGNLNYRMTKKRPQYYSGPIEGFGSISNNIKPTIHPVEASACPSTLFNTDQNQPAPSLTTGYNAPIMQSPSFDISSQSTIDPYITQGQSLVQPDYNTAFDLSRPTTEKLEQPQSSEPKGFGIIGSLKSKLSSIDINKIQNTVTTFFDPAYNESKVDPNKGTETSFPSGSGNYQNFPQHESATLEVFVPNIDNQYHQTNPYNYQIQAHQTYQNQQYYPNQDYFDPSQSYSNKFYPSYPSVTDLSKTDSYIPVSNATSESQVGNSDGIQPSNTQQFTDFPLSRNQEYIQSVTNPTNNEKRQSQIVETATSAIDDFGVTVDSKRDENIRSILNPISVNDISEVVEETAITDSIKKVIQPPTNLFKEVKAISVNNNNNNITSNTDIIKELQSVADSTLKNVFDCQTPVVVDSALDNDNQVPLVIPEATTDPLKSFFDYQQPICQLAASITDDSKPTVCNPLTNVDSSLKCFFDQTPTTDLCLGMKDFPESSQFKGLCPVLKTKSEDLQTSVISTVQNSLNDTPLFSLFDQPPLLPAMPSFDLSKISASSLPASINESSDIKNIETKMDNISLYDNIDNMTKFERKSTFFDKTMPMENDINLIDNQVSELNICETCREVNKADEKEADLTTQLIENITAPIQLANPVEFSAVVGAAVGTAVPDISDFSNQFAEISYVPEDIIETMKQPPSVELKDDSINTAINFGWSVSESKSPKPVIEHDYNFPPDPNIIGFYGNNSLFFENVPTNASDEIKAEYKISQEDTTILPLQLSVATAPPEEDTNSDESGLDVHSIEQDAKKDFPIYEEFVIEPSETDDDKIEYKEREKYTEDMPQDVDTFTNRVERFKQMETSTEVLDDTEVLRAAKPITLATSTSPAITIASYFDTGNYAVENHYKNSLTSPTTISFNTNISSPTTIPPGFEDKFNRKLSGISSADIPVGLNVGNIVHIPETSTQTALSVSLTFSQPNNSASINVVTTESATLSSSFVQETIPTKPERLPAFSSIIESKNEAVEDNKPPVVDDNTLETRPLIVDSSSDSVNFFASTEESSANSDAYSNFSRLSSYFTSPPQPDHSKSFFELSQSQNHYRHKPEQFDSIQNNVKNFFESDSNKTNIPENYLINMNLIRDLASHKSVTPINDTVKTVNYFTVEYHIDSINVGEPKSSLGLTDKNSDSNYDQPNELGNIDDINFNVEDLIKKCKYCYDTVNVDINCTDTKMKSCMDNSESKKGDADMATKKDIKKSVTINFCDPSYHNETNDRVAITSENRNSSEYAPVKHHWFYRVDCEGKSIWRGFSVADSRALENAFNSPDLNENTVVATDGGRFDVNVVGRLRIPVYWADKPTNVMRCSWFYKGNIDARYVPYSESVAEKLEEEYHHGVTTGEWHRRLMLPNNEMVVMHGPAVMVHFLQTSPTDAFSSTPLFTFGKRVYRNPPKIKVAGDQHHKIDHLIFLVHGAGEYRHQKEKIQSTMRPRVVRRGCVESEIEDTEPSSIDHLLLLCHGVGSACDMRFRSVEEVVDDFRTTSLQLIQSHYKNSYENGLIGRVEVLPISWHSSLHSGETGVDKRLAAVTLESIPRLRNFTNDTILDVLFYTSPVYCQTIVDTVCSELNRIYKLFKSRNPDFKGGVSLGGHSLGSVILYDLLCHQKTAMDSNSSKLYVPGCAGTGQPSVKYPRLTFQPDALYALGSPIAIFECIRGVETLGKDFCLPTCRNFFNIFHPYDPIAYRLEPMINPLLRHVKPYLIPHHKGRKRMHLELKDTMARVGADIKQKLIESIRSTWTSMWKRETTGQVGEVVEEETEKEELTADSKEENNQYEATPEELGRLNGGRRIDHVLQEAPFEIFNEYLFAMTSHVCYWESEDTMLVMLREIYNSLGVTPDCSLPQQTMTVERTKIQDDPDTTKIMTAEYPSTSRGSS